MLKILRSVYDAKPKNKAFIIKQVRNSLKYFYDAYKLHLSKDLEYIISTFLPEYSEFIEYLPEYIDHPNANVKINRLSNNYNIIDIQNDQFDTDGEDENLFKFTLLSSLYPIIKSNDNFELRFIFLYLCVIYDLFEIILHIYYRINIIVCSFDLYSKISRVQFGISQEADAFGMKYCNPLFCLQLICPKEYPFCHTDLFCYNGGLEKFTRTMFVKYGMKIRIIQDNDNIYFYCRSINDIDLIQTTPAVKPKDTVFESDTFDIWLKFTVCKTAKIFCKIDCNFNYNK